MNLEIITGLEQSKNAFQRVDPLDVTSLPHEVSRKTFEVFGENLSPLESVERILQDVRSQGDSALRRYTKALDGADLDAIKVPKEELAAAWNNLPPALADALELAAQRVQDFHRPTMRQSWLDLPSGLGELVIPLERVGIYVPGGTAAYPSTVLMTAIPAKVAGVKDIILTSPVRGAAYPDPVVMAAAHLAGVDQVFAVGGVQAIGAMAYGTETIPKVDKICGPGNIFVTLAKKLVFGHVDIDGLYGPTETVVVADDTANPVYCAADLLAQAEHDPLACPILVTTSLPLVAKVEAELDKQVALMDRGDMARASMEAQGKVFLMDDLEQALELANSIAPEHLCMMVNEPWAWAAKVKHAGGVFLGEYSPEVMGDYVAGPSHVMPTGGTARFNSALSVHHFLKTMPVVGLKPEDYPPLARAASQIAHAEGLMGHARAVEVRLEDLEGGR